MRDCQMWTKAVARHLGIVNHEKAIDCNHEKPCDLVHRGSDAIGAMLEGSSFRITATPTACLLQH